jgi:hypothetical protein
MADCPACLALLKLTCLHHSLTCLMAIDQSLVPVLTCAAAGNEWLQQGLSMNMAGPAGRAALGAPMFPLALEGEPHETPPSGQCLANS